MENTLGNCDPGRFYAYIIYGNSSALRQSYGLLNASEAGK